MNLRRYFLTFVLLVGAIFGRDIVTEYPDSRVDQASTSPTADTTAFASQLSGILSRHIFRLDQDLIVFRYETPDFKLQTLPEVQKHVADWTDRFFDPDIVTHSNQEGALASWK